MYCAMCADATFENELQFYKAQKDRKGFHKNQ